MAVLFEKGVRNLGTWVARCLVEVVNAFITVLVQPFNLLKGDETGLHLVLFGPKREVNVLLQL